MHFQPCTQTNNNRVSSSHLIPVTAPAATAGFASYKHLPNVDDDGKVLNSYEE